MKGERKAKKFLRNVIKEKLGMTVSSKELVMAEWTFDLTWVSGEIGEFTYYSGKRPDGSTFLNIKKGEDDYIM